MNQFDLVANPFPGSRARQSYLVALESDLLARSLDTVVVAPLEPAVAAGSYADRLNPQVAVGSQAYMLIAQELVTVRRSALGLPQGSIAADRDKVIAALDLLFTGF